MKQGSSIQAARSFWCEGCGNHGALEGINAAIAWLAVPPHLLVVVSGVGCAGKTSGFLPAYAVQAPHGRALAIATGIAFANPALTVLVVGGDADGYAIGISHLVHAAKRDVNVTYVVLNNETMALTEGQRLPGCSDGQGSFDPLAIALASGAGFVARGNAGQPGAIEALVRRAMLRRGFAIVDVRSPCVIYGETQRSVPRIGSESAGRDVVDAFRQLIETDDVGVIYERPETTAKVREVLLSPPRESSDLDRLIAHAAAAPQGDTARVLDLIQPA